MKIALRPPVKGHPPPAWLFVGVGMLVVLGVAWAVSKIPARLIPPCGFHVVTGHPCPTCGATRMVLRVLQGNLPEAFRMNPFLFIVAALLALWVACGLAARLFGRDLTLEVSRREEAGIWIALFAGFLLNWAYLWNAGI